MQVNDAPTGVSQRQSRTPQAIPSSDRDKYKLAPTRRWPTAHRGISYRVLRDGSRRYLVFHKGEYVPAGDSLEQARVKQGELQKAKSIGTKVVTPTKVTFGEYAAKWWEEKEPTLRPKTRTLYEDALRLVLRPRFGDWLLGAIDADAVAMLIRDLEREGLHAIDPSRDKRPLGRSSIENYLKPLQGTLKKAKRRGLVASNPLADLDKEERPKDTGEKAAVHEWTTEETSSLLTAASALAEEPASRYDYTPLLLLTSRMGLRLGEVVGLQWGDFDKDKSLLRVRRQWTRFGEYGPTKTPAGVRDLQLPDDLRSELIKLKLQSGHNADGDPIFASRKGTPLLHRNVVRRGFDCAAEKAGIDGVTFHDLRHAAVSRLIAANVPITTVAKFIGHDDPNVTLKVYGHLYDRAKQHELIRVALRG
jgi:integrase